MADEYRLGEWHVHWGESEVQVLDQENSPIATVHGGDGEEAFRRALLIAAAPSLRDWVLASLEIFSLFAAEEEGRVGEAAAEMIEGLRVALSNAGAEPGEAGEKGRGPELPISGEPS